MSLYHYRFAILFYAVVIALLYIFRNKFDREGSFVFLYRTKYGLRLMDFLARFRRFYWFFGISGVIVSYPGILFITGSIVYMLYKSLISAPRISVAPVLPGLPIAGTGMVFPLITGWLCLFIIMVIHESSHGILSRLHKIKIKSSGIAFFGPLLAAFVEPDEKQLAKKPLLKQLMVYAAGPFSNIVTAFIFLLFLSLVFSPLLTRVSSVQAMIVEPKENYPAWNAGIKNATEITSINNISVSNKDFFKSLNTIKPNETVIVTTSDGKEYFINTTENPENSSRGYLGVVFKGVKTAPKGNPIIYSVIKWLHSFFFWLWFISINIGLINLFPIYITDGAKIVEVTLNHFIKSKDKARKINSYINASCLIVILLLLFLPLIRMLF